MREIIDNDTTTRDKISINGLGMKKSKSGGVYIILKTGIEVAQDYTVFDYGSPIPHEDVKSQYRTVVAGPGFNLAPKYFLPGNRKEKFGKETPQIN